MADKRNDMFAIMLNQPDATYEDMLLHGITADNTGLQNADYYKNLDAVRNNEYFKNENGNFDENRFNNFYDSVLNSYNTFSKDDYEKHLIESLDKDPLDWTQPFKSNVKDVTAIIYRGSGDFGRRAKGITGIGSIGAPVFSMREIAQDSQAKDENGFDLGWTPNNHGFFQSIFAPTMVLATWDENGTHVENGRTVRHRKGEYKLNENGDPFYEKLGNRDSYGKEVLRITDTLTVDGTPINKWDFLDSDGLDKSISKTILQTAAYVAPMLIPGMSTIWGTIGMIGGLTSALPTLLKGVNGILGSNDSPYGRALTSAESWLERWKPTKSDASQNKFLSWENLGEIIRSSSIQLFSQRRVAELSRLLLKGEDTLKNTKIGQALSLGYMALTSSTDTYSLFKEAGASDAAAGLGMLGTMAALYGLMSTDYFKDALFKGTWIDESEANNVIKNYSRDNIERLVAAETNGLGMKDLVDTPQKAAGFFNKVQETVKKGWERFIKSSASGTPKDLTVAKNMAEDGAKTGARKMLSTFNVILNRSVNEGIEETMEEVAQDMIKAVFAGADALGMKVTEEPGEHLDFGWTFEEAMQRYLTSFGGGFLGGAVFEGINQYEDTIYKRPRISDLNNTSEQMLFLVLNGKADEIKERARLFRDKGVLGNKNLSIKNFTQKDGKTRFQAGTDNDNQNEFAYQLIVHEVDRLEKLLSDNGITRGAILRYLTEFGGNLNNLSKLDTVQSAAIKKLAFHTTFMDDLVKLSKDLVRVQSQIDDLQHVSTDAEERRENTEPSKELEDLQKIKKDLLDQKDAFFNHENDREYIEQAMYLSNAELQRNTLNIVSNGETLNDSSTFNPETYALTGETGFANYVWLRYHKKLGNLSETEKNFYKVDYDQFVSDPDNISNIQTVGKTLFQVYKNVNEAFALPLSSAEAMLKDIKVNPLYVHTTLSSSPEYKLYLNAKSAIDNLNAELIRIQGKITSLDPDSEEYTTQLSKLQEIKDSIEQNQALIDDFESMYDSITDIFTEVPTEEGQSIETGIQTAAINIKDLIDVLKNPELDENVKLESQLAIKSNFKRITDLAMSYFNVLKDNNVIAGNAGNLLLKNVMRYASEIAKSIPSETFDPNSDISSLFGFDSNYSYTLDMLPAMWEGIKEILETGTPDEYKEAIENLKGLFNGETRVSSESVSDEQMQEESTKAIDAFQKSVFGINLLDWFKQVDEIQKSAKTYDVIDLLRDMQIGIDDDVKSLLDLIEDSKKSLLSSKALEDFSLQPNAKAALTKVESLLMFPILAIQSAWDGTNHTINLLPKTDKDVVLAEITDNTKNRLVEDIFYLIQTVSTMLGINAANENTKKGYPQKAETFFHQNLMNQILNGEKENEATWVGKFYTKFHVDIKDLWDKAGTETDVTVNYDSLTVNNYSEFKKRYIRFWQLLRDEIQTYDDGGTEVRRSDAEIGDLLGSMLDDKAKLGLYGEVKTADEQNNNLTNLGIVVVIGALLNEDYGEFFKNYIKEQKAKDYKYMPFMQQELAVHVSYEFAISNENSVLSHIANAINDKNVNLPNNINDKDKLEESWNSLKLLNHLFFVQGGTGAGKTSATSLMTYRLLKRKYGDALDVEVLAPTDSQYKPYAETLDISDATKISDYPSFIKTLINSLEDEDLKTIDFYNLDLTDLKEDTKLNSVFEGRDTRLSSEFLNTVKTKFAEKYNPRENYFIFADESQFLNVACLQLLNAYAEATDAKVIMYGDKKQNGAVYKRGDAYAESSVADALVLSCPSLGESLRFENIAKERNYKAIKNCLDKIEENISDNYLRDANAIGDAAKTIIESRKTIGLNVTFRSWEDQQTFVGEKSIKETDVEKYVSKVKSLSEKLHEDGKSQICIITEDKSKYEEYLDMEGVTVSTPREVQGREYDFVIIDKSFDPNNLYTAYKDVYTLMGRSRIGTLFVGDLDNLQISFEESQDKTLSNIINNEQSFSEFYEWKDNVFDEVLKTFGEAPEETTEETEESEKEKKDENSEQKDDEKLSLSDELESQVANEPEAAIPGDAQIEAPHNQGGIDEVNSGEKTIDARIEADRKVIIDRVKSENNLLYNWNDFVNWALDEKGLLLSEGLSNDGKVSNKYSILSDFLNVSTNKTDIITMFRKFASAVLYNMDIQNHHVLTFQNLVGRRNQGVIQKMVSNWNDERKNGKHTFVAYGNDSARKSIIYWRTTIDGNTKLIPVSIVDGVVNGQITISGKENLFTKVDDFWGVKGNPDNTCISINHRETSIGSVSQLKIFTPDESQTFAKNDEIPSEIDTTSGSNEYWFKNNSGHGMMLVSDCEILQDQDFEQVFNIKRSKAGVIYGFNIESNTNRTLNGKKPEASQGNILMSVNINGAKVSMLAINPHKYVDLPTLYNIANIARFANGQIPWSGESGLTEIQRQLIGENSKQKAEAFVADYIGQFDLESTSSNQAAKNKKNIAINKRKMHYDYRLLTKMASYNLLGTTFAAIYKLSKEEDKDWFEYFMSGLFKATFKTHKAERSGITYDNGLYFSVEKKNGSGRPTYNRYFIEFEQVGTKYDVRISQLKWDSGVLSDYKKAKVVVIKNQDLRDISIFSIFDKIDNTVTEEDLIDRLGKGSIQIQYLQRCTRDGDVFYNTSDDYNIVAGMYNAIPKVEGILKKIETEIKKYPTFRDGFTLNENRQITTEKETARKATGWADSKHTKDYLIKSNLRRIEGSLWALPISDFVSRSEDLPNNLGMQDVSSLNGDFTFNALNPKWNNGKILEPNAEVDDKWLSQFTEEGSFEHNGKPVKSARIKSIDFSTGQITFGVGLSTYNANLKKDAINQYPSVEEISRGTIKTPGFNINGVSFNIVDGKIMASGQELHPLWEKEGLVTCVSPSELTITISKTLLADNGITTNVPVVTSVGNNVYFDQANGDFYSNTKKLGKILDYLENNIIFANGLRVEYTSIEERYIPQSIKDKRAASGDISTTSKKESKIFRERPIYEIDKTGFAEKVENVIRFYGKSWIVNGKWLYDNSNYTGGDGSFSIVSFNESTREIVTSDGQKFILNQNTNVPKELVTIDGAKIYLKSLLRKKSLLSKNVQDAIDLKLKDISENIELVNKRLFEENKDFQIDASNSFEFKLTEINPAEYVINNFAKQNNITITGEMQISDDISIVEAQQTSNDAPENISIYSVNRIATAGISYQLVKTSIINWLNENPQLSSIIQSLIDNPFSKVSLQTVLTYLESEEGMTAVSDEAYNKFVDISNMVNVLQQTIDNLRNNKTNCEWHA